MKKFIFTVLTIALTLSITPTVFANDNDSESKSENFMEIEKNKIYINYYSDYSYSDFEYLYEIYTENYGPQVSIDYNAGNSLKMYSTRATIATDYASYFTKSIWVDRNDGVTLSVYYKDYIFDNGRNQNVTMAKAGKAWSALKNKHQNDSKWDNTDSMEAQFHCHAVTIGKLKNPWNIEPWRTESNLVTVIANKCNP